MTNSELFIKAHAMTKANIEPGESYQVVFGQCLKLIKNGHDIAHDIHSKGETMKNTIKHLLGYTGLLIVIAGILMTIVSFMKVNDYTVYSVIMGIAIVGILGIIGYECLDMMDESKGEE